MAEREETVMNSVSTNRPGLFGRAVNTGLHAAPLVACAVLLGRTVGDRLAMEAYFLKWSYYLILGLVVWWVASGVRYLRSRALSPACLARTGWPGLAAALVLTLSVAASVPMEFKTLSDETNLVSVSKSMLESRTCRNVTMSKVYYGQPHTVSYAVPKRPLVFPFLLHLYHLFLGFDYHNAFYLNLTVLFVLLSGIYLVFARLADPIAALAAMLLVLSMPLVPILATSAGFDLLNSTFLLLVLLLAAEYLKRQDARSFSFLWLSLLVFANIRYESLFFAIVIVVLLAAVGKIRASHIRGCSLELCATALIMLPTFWQRIVTVKSTSADEGATFSLAHLLSHGRDLVKSLADFGFHLPYANLLTGAGIAVYAYLLWWHVRNHRHIDNRHKATAALLGIVTVLNVLFYLAYYWGRYDHPSSARFFVFMSMAVALAPVWLHRFKPQWLNSRGLLGVAAASMLLYYPVAVNNAFMDSLTLNRLTRHELAYLASYPREDVMAVTIRPGQMVAAGYGAVNFRYANKPVFVREVRRHLYPHVIVFQKIRYRDHRPTSDTRLKADLPLRTRQEVQITSKYYLRISEVRHAGIPAPPPTAGRQNPRRPALPE